MPQALCSKCGVRLDQVHLDAGFSLHPICEKTDSNEAAGMAFLSDLTDIIRWTDNNSTRSLQTTIGPSELGGACDRRIAYRLLGADEVNHWTDPWPAIVGTSIHAWLEKAITKFQQVHHMERWLTEVTCHPDPLVVGHCDLYDKELKMVIDFKTVSPTKLKDWNAHGPSDAYKSQVNLYAKGLVAAGYPVQRVCLVALPRAGMVGQFRVWTDLYNPERAQVPLDRMYAIGAKLIEQGEDLKIADIPASPGGDCAYCPWYRGGNQPGSLTGCPGNSDVSEERFGKGLIRGK